MLVPVSNTRLSNKFLESLMVAEIYVHGASAGGCANDYFCQVKYERECHGHLPKQSVS